MIEQNPLPSYISIHDGQTVTGRYCQEAGHMQSTCLKKKQDFPQLGSQTADQSTSQHEFETAQYFKT